MTSTLATKKSRLYATSRRCSQIKYLLLATILVRRVALSVYDILSESLLPMIGVAIFTALP